MPSPYESLYHGHGGASLSKVPSLVVDLKIRRQEEAMYRRKLWERKQ